jgi:tRNA (guanine-N7-)-methyltransferase
MRAPDPDHPTANRIRPHDWLHPLPLADYFPRRQPLEIDLGCGKGRFLLARAAANPHTNFLGIERMLRRVRKVDNKVRRGRLDNVRLLRMEGYYATTFLVPPESVQTYYVLFPDPWPKKRHHGERLFSPRFMDAIHRTLLPGGCLHVATDHLPYYEEIRALIGADTRFTPVAPFVPREEEQTDFERYYVTHKEIGRCSFRKKEGQSGRAVYSGTPPPH